MLQDWWYPTVNFFKFQTCAHTPSTTKQLNFFVNSAHACIQQRTITSRQGLKIRLQRYLIVFDNQTFALYQRKHIRTHLTHWMDSLKSSNFTSRPTIPRPSFIPLEKYITSRRPSQMLLMLLFSCVSK